LTHDQIETAERYIIGSALASGQVAEGITEDHFANDHHKAAWRCIASMAASDKPIDLVLVTEALRDRLDTVGGAAYLTRMASEAFTDVYLGHYVKVLLQANVERQARAVIDKAKEQADNGELDVADTANKLLALSTHSNGRAQWHSLIDLIDYTPDPSHVIAGDGWLRRGGCTILTGGTGIGKSVLAMQIAVCVAGGVRLFRGINAGIDIPVARRVLYVQAENDMLCLQRDFIGVLSHERPPQSVVADNLCIVTYPGDTPQRLGAWLIQTVKARSFELVVIDPYSAFVSGDTNSTDTFFKFRDAVSPSLHHAGMLLVCHTPKPADRSNWTARESVYLAAGTSALANWARCSCELTNPQASQDTRYRLRLSKNAERAGLGRNADGQIVRDIYLEHGKTETPYWQVSDEQGEERSLTTQERVKMLLDEKPHITQREVAAILNVSVGTINTCFKKIKQEQTQ